MRIALAVLILPAYLLLQGGAGEPTRLVSPAGPTPSTGATPGVLVKSLEDQACQTGCAIAAHNPPPLDKADLARFVARYAEAPIDEPGEALETLLFYGDQSRELLDDLPSGALDADRRRFLLAQLSRQQVRLAVRVVDERGVARVRLDASDLPLGIKQHLHAGQTVGMQPPEISGTVRRVGLDHLWTRL